ncbi:MAG: ribulose-phosphate 3-epimerase [Candidatus Methanomethylophilaceae archaeon]|nr:ribulose-phosphate 3-epimerase [Candidatus Methanomethylophilaceae archaeon]MDY5873153.1 ribulose-phosphate 3-epimerase [Candidatus Methanomethylophilaceae archaeon]
MVIVAPSMLSADFSRLGEELSRITEAGADWAHLDVMDGMFVPNITIGPLVVEAIRPISDITFDVHLMIQDPIRYVDQFAKAGADYITVHTEAEGDIMGAIERIRELGKHPGISLNPDTPVSEIERYLEHVDLILVMTVQPGFGGQKFRENGPEKISRIRKMADATGRRILVSVDGGINRDTGRRCVEAGVDVLAAGSYLFKQEDMATEIALWKGF